MTKATRKDDLPLPRPAFLFDLDGTLVDSVYQHVRPGEKPWNSMESGSRSGGFIGVLE
jgi:phosphoglycolate phosphatase-like HAD superfamily hydrolase